MLQMLQNSVLRLYYPSAFFYPLPVYILSFRNITTKRTSFRLFLIVNFIIFSLFVCWIYSREEKAYCVEEKIGRTPLRNRSRQYNEKFNFKSERWKWKRQNRTRRKRKDKGKKGRKQKKKKRTQKKIRYTSRWWFANFILFFSIIIYTIS